MVRSVDIEEDLRGVSYSSVNKGFMEEVKEVSDNIRIDGEVYKWCLLRLVEMGGYNVCQLTSRVMKNNFKGVC